RILFTLTTAVGANRWDKAQIVVQSVKTGERKTIANGSDGRYLPSGHLLYTLGGVVLAVPFDIGRLEKTGPPVPVIGGVARAPGAQTGATQFSVSTNGSLAYVPGPTAPRSNLELSVVDRSGAVEQLHVTARAYQSPRVSPDGKWLAVGTDDGRDANIWV